MLVDDADDSWGVLGSMDGNGLVSLAVVLVLVRWFVGDRFSGWKVKHVRYLEVSVFLEYVGGA